MGEGSSRASRGTSVGVVLGPSFVPPCSCSWRFAKNKATRILADASKAISPRMRHSFVDKQYLPSTSMDWSEWEIILGELIHMGFLVKKEHVSEGDD
jgi:hypothetical protein